LSELITTKDRLKATIQDDENDIDVVFSLMMDGVQIGLLYVGGEPDRQRGYVQLYSTIC
jgi:hypothetical protein